MIFNNTGKWDRLLRIAAGIVMLVFGWRADPGSWVFSLRILALYPLITGLLGWCPVYALLHIRSLKK